MQATNINDQKRVEFMLSKLKIERLESFVKGMEFQEPRQCIGDRKYRDFVIQHSIFADESNVHDLAKRLDREQEYNRELNIFVEKQKSKERAKAMSVYREGYMRSINDMLNNRDIKPAESRTSHPT